MTKRGVLARLSMGVVDQVFSSLSNFLALLVAARYLSAHDFGAFSVISVTYMLTLGFVRALCSEALLVRPGDTRPGRRLRERLATGSAVNLGFLVLVVFTVAGFFPDGALGACLVALGVAMPGLLLQDTLRYAAFARSEARIAVTGDGIWLFGQVPCYLILIHWGTPSAVAMVVIWAGLGVASGIYMAWHEGVRPALAKRVDWIRQNADLSGRYALDYFSAQGASQIASYVLVIAAGVAALGSVRGAQTLFGPLNILYTGAYIVLVPEGRFAVEKSPMLLARVSMLASAVFATVAGVLTVVLVTLPDDVGTALLGSTWDAASEVMVPVGLAAVVSGVLAGALAGLRSLADAKRLLRLRLTLLPLSLGVPAVGAVLGEASGLAWGVVVVISVNVVAYWTSYMRALRGHVPVDDADTSAGTSPLGL